MPKPLPTLKLLTATLILLFVLRQLDSTQLTSAISSAHLNILIIICLIYPFVIALSTLKWRLLLNAFHLSVPFHHLYSLYWVSAVFGTLLPTDFGADAFKLLHLKRTLNFKLSPITASIFYDRFIGFLAIAITLSLTAPFHLRRFITLTAPHPLTPFILLAALILVLLVISIKIPAKLRSLSSFLKPVPSLPVLIRCLTFSLILVVTGVFTTHLAFSAFNQPVPLSLIFFLVPLLNLTGLIPLTPQSLGIKEGLGVYLYSLYGISPEIVFSVLITTRALAIICNALGLPLLTRLKPATVSPNN